MFGGLGSRVERGKYSLQVLALALVRKRGGMQSGAFAAEGAQGNARPPPAQRRPIQTDVVFTI